MTSDLSMIVIVFTHELRTVCLSQTRTWERWDVLKWEFLFRVLGFLGSLWMGFKRPVNLQNYKIPMYVYVFSGGRIHRFY